MGETRVYISFAEADRIACDRVAACLRDAGADVSCAPREPSDAPPNDAERDAELRSRLLFVVLLSEAAYESPRIERECRMAVTLARQQPRRRIVPLVVHPTHYIGTWTFLDGISRLHLYEIPAPLLAERILTPPDTSQNAPQDVPLEDDTEEELVTARRYRGLARAEARNRIPSPDPERTNIRFTREMMSVLGRAQAKAVDRQHPVIEPEHLLFGIVTCPSAGALEVLAACAVRPQLIQARLHATLPWGDRPLRALVRMSSRSKQAITQAVSVGREIGQPYFGTIQLLLGILAEDGATARLLEDQGLTREDTQAAAARLLRRHAIG